MVGYGGVNRSTLDLALELERLEDGDNLFLVYVDTQPALDLCRRHRRHHRFWRVRVVVHDSLADGSASQRAHQLCGSPCTPDRLGRMDSSAKAGRCLRG